MSYEYKNYEFFVVDQHGTTVVDLVELGLSPKYDGSSHNTKGIVAVCDFLNFVSHTVSYSVPSRWVRIPRMQTSSRNLPAFGEVSRIYKIAELMKGSKSFSSYAASFYASRNAVGENEANSDVKIPAYEVKGHASFRVVAHNFKTGKTYEIDACGTTKNQIQLFIPYGLKSGTDCTALVKQFSVDYVRKISSAVTKFYAAFTEKTTMKLFSAHCVDEMYDIFARAVTCKMLSTFWRCPRFNDVLGTDPVKFISGLSELVSSAPILMELLEILSEKSEGELQIDATDILFLHKAVLKTWVTALESRIAKQESNHVAGEVYASTKFSYAKDQKKMANKLDAKRKRERLATEKKIAAASAKQVADRQAKLEAQALAALTPEQIELGNKARLADQRAIAATKKK
jgi:hypothetical protein